MLQIPELLFKIQCFIFLQCIFHSAQRCCKEAAGGCECFCMFCHICPLNHLLLALLFFFFLPVLHPVFEFLISTFNFFLNSHYIQMRFFFYEVFTWTWLVEGALDLSILRSLFIERLSRHYNVHHLFTLYLSSLSSSWSNPPKILCNLFSLLCWQTFIIINSWSSVSLLL